MTAPALSKLERAARAAWLSHAADIRYGSCGTCGRVLDEDGHNMLVARQERGRVYECLECWDTSGKADQGVRR